MARISLQFVAMSLTGAALLSLSAAAQSNQGNRLIADSHSARIESEIKFEVLSLRPVRPGSDLSSNSAPSPNGFRARLSIWQAIQLAYAPEFDLVSGFREMRNQPNWSGDFYDIEARVSNADLAAWQHQSSRHELLRAAMRAALKDRCKLAVHEQPSKGPNLELVIGTRGPLLKPAAPVAADLVGSKLPSGGVCVGTRSKGQKEVLHCYGATMGDLVWFLGHVSRVTPIRDRTNLTGRYDFTLQEIDEPSQRESDAVDNYPIDHLGLKLKPGTESRPILVIDHIEKPTAN
jgi:uncharacterized protein (TIGR03435 family)